MLGFVSTGARRLFQQWELRFMPGLRVRAAGGGGTRGLGTHRCGCVGESMLQGNIGDSMGCSVSSGCCGADSRAGVATDEASSSESSESSSGLIELRSESIISARCGTPITSRRRPPPPPSEPELCKHACIRGQIEREADCAALTVPGSGVSMTALARAPVSPSSVSSAGSPTAAGNGSPLRACVGSLGPRIHAGPSSVDFLRMGILLRRADTPLNMRWEARHVSMELYGEDTLVMKLSTLLNQRLTGGSTSAFCLEFPHLTKKSIR